MKSRLLTVAAVAFVAAIAIYFSFTPFAARQAAESEKMSRFARQVAAIKKLTPLTEAPAKSTAKPAVASTELWHGKAVTAGRRPADFRTTRMGRTTFFDVENVTSFNTVKKGDSLVIPLVGTEQVTAGVNLVMDDINGIRRIGGSLHGARQGTLSLAQKGSEIRGKVLLPLEHLAYTISTTADGLIEVREESISQVVCDPYPASNIPASGVQRLTGANDAAPVLSSRPGAPAVLYLDFDGETVVDPSWNGGNTIVAAPTNLSTEEMTSVWERVKEDYLPFNIDVTTNGTHYDSAPVGKRMRVIITPSNSWYPGVGGVAVINSFAKAGTLNESSSIPCWVFNYDVSGITEAISHELGHTLGLSHDGLTNPPEEYYYGQSNWAPIMGVGYYTSIVQWSKGEYANANNTEDDLAIISGNTNGFGYVTDDYGNDRATASSLPVSSNLFYTTGLISSATDQDYFSVAVATKGSLDILVNPAQNSPNLDVYAELINDSGTVLSTSNPPDSLDGHITKAVQPGTYYIRVMGTGRGSALTDGYSSYGSIGAYSITGTIGPYPTAPTVVTQPQSTTLYEGGNVYLYVSVSGGAPISYQWQKNSVDIPGATNSSYSINKAVLADTANYRVIVSNDVGSDTSNNALVTVNPTPPPTWSYGPYNGTYVEGDMISLYAGFSFNGNSSVSYQWYKNGDPISGATSYNYNIGHCTLDDAGSYQLKATNSGGSATSRNGVITVLHATIPVITSQPQSSAVQVGDDAFFTVGASSNASLTYQWFKNGVAIVGATSSYYSIYGVSYSDGANYNVVVTSPAGTATSDLALLTVIPVQPPKITSQPSTIKAVIGGSASFYVIASGVGAITYQWYKNGVPIQDATISSYSVSNISASDLAAYYVAVTNSAGTTNSSLAYLDIDPTGTVPGYYWLSMRAVDSVGYFLYRNPARIERYDFAAEAWLSNWTTRASPTAFAVASDAIYASFGTNVYKYTRSFTGETLLLTATFDVKSLEVAGSYLIVSSAQSSGDARLASYDRSNGTKISEFTSYQGPMYLAYSPSSKNVIIRESIYWTHLRYDTLENDGTLTPKGTTPYTETTSRSIRPFTLSNGTFVSDEDGIVYKGSDLDLKGSMGGPIQDAVELGTNYVVALRSDLKLLDANFRETGSFPLTSRADRLYVKASKIFAITQPTKLGERPAVQTIQPSQFNAPAKAATFDPQAHSYKPESIVADANGIVYLLDTASNNIYRWSGTAGKYLRSIPTVGSPTFLGISDTADGLFYNSSTYQIRKVSLSDVASDQAYFTSPLQVRAISGADDNLYVVDALDYYSGSHYLVDSSGAIATYRSDFYTDLPFASLQYTWSHGSGRVYYSQSHSLYADTFASGKFATTLTRSSILSDVTSTPVRVSNDGTLVLMGDGKFYDGFDLSYIGSLGFPISDALWTANRLFTLQTVGSTTSVEGRSVLTFTKESAQTLSGTPLRAFELPSGQILVLTLDGNYVNFWKLSASDLSIVSHPDSTHVLPKPDFDGDGKADAVFQNLATGERSIWLLNGTTKGSTASLPTQDTHWVIAATADFNDDGSPDIVWQNDATGQRVIWLMNGTAFKKDIWLPTQPIQWQIVAAGDFNQDGDPDLVWQNNTTGERVIWLMKGTSFVTDVGLPTQPIAWSIVGCGDMNTDGKTDLIWQNTKTGQRVVWIMNNTSFFTDAQLPSASPEWQIGSVADYNRDGYMDLLEQNIRTGERSIRLLTGTAEAGFISLGTTSVAWSAGRPLTAPPPNPADFNNDRQPDIIAQNLSTGERSIWLMNGVTKNSASALPSQPASWEIATYADFDGDSKPDLVWQNTLTGQRVIWLMNGAVYKSEAWLPTQPTTWQIVASADFDLDGKTDLVWQNLSTGERVIWLMNGTNYRTDATLGNLSKRWEIVGTGDFNLDGKPDIFLQNARSGLRRVWVMNGTTITSSVDLEPQQENWQITAVSDFNGDGSLDFAEQNVRTGERGIRLLNDGTQTGWSSLGTLNSNWSLGRPLNPPATNLADFNEDGKPDLFVQNTTSGARSILLMANGVVQSEVALATQSVDWQIATTGDFNADGAPDLVWQNTKTGQRVIWLMDMTTFMLDVPLPNQPTQWQICAAADFNDDGQTDLVWQNSASGERVIWYMNGNHFAGDHGLPTQPLAWSIVGAGDINRDGYPDLIWQNTTTGERVVWYMNAAAMIGDQSLGTPAADWQIAAVNDFDGDGYVDFVERNVATGERAIRYMTGASQKSFVSLGVAARDSVVGRPLR